MSCSICGSSANHPIHHDASSCRYCKAPAEHHPFRVEHVTSVSQLEARPGGSLSGWRAECSCGWYATTSLSRLFVDQDAAEHVNFMLARASA